MVFAAVLVDIVPRKHHSCCRLAAAVDGLLAFDGSGERSLEEVIATLEQEVEETGRRFRSKGLVGWVWFFTCVVSHCALHIVHYKKC